MNFEETGILLGKIAAIDNRTVDQVTIAAWQELLVHVNLKNAMAALNAHRTQRPDAYLQPGHIIEGAKAARRANLDRMRTPEPPSELNGDVAREIDWTRAYRTAVGDGSEHPDDVADAALGIGRHVVETARPVTQLVTQAASTTTVPREVRDGARRDVASERRAS